MTDDRPPTLLWMLGYALVPAVLGVAVPYWMVRVMGWPWWSVFIYVVAGLLAIQVGFAWRDYRRARRRQRGRHR